MKLAAKIIIAIIVLFAGNSIADADPNGNLRQSDFQMARALVELLADSDTFNRFEREERAAEYIGSLLRIYPDHPQLLIWLGDMEFLGAVDLPDYQNQSKRYGARAKAFYLRAADKGMLPADTHCALSWIAFIEKDYALAEKEAKVAVSLDDQLMCARLVLSMVSIEKRDFTKAKQYVDELHALPIGHLNAGICEYNTRKDLETEFLKEWPARENEEKAGVFPGQGAKVEKGSNKKK